MAPDRQLSANFWLHEFPCYEHATEADVAFLQETVDQRLQPTRDRFGRIVPTSWRWWRRHCTPREGAHGDPGTVDIVPLDAPIPEVHRWMAAHVPYGEVIDEFDHIHITRPGVGDPHGPEALVGDRASGFVAVDPTVGFPGGEGTYGRPFDLPGLTVSVARFPNLRWAVAGAVLLLVASAAGRDVAA